MKLITLAAVFLLSGCTSVPRRIDHHFTILKSGIPLSDALVHVEIRGRKAHWWEDPTLTGDWRSLDERENVQKQFIRTDVDGRIHIYGRGIRFWVAVFYDYEAFGLFSSAKTRARHLPSSLDLDDAIYVCPAFTYALRDKWMSNHPLIKELFAKERGSWLRIEVKLSDGGPARWIPYEVFYSKTGQTLARYVTNAGGTLYLFVPNNHLFNVGFYPGEDSWPGMTGERPRTPHQDAMLYKIKPGRNPPQEIRLEAIVDEDNVPKGNEE